MDFNLVFGLPLRGTLDSAQVTVFVNKEVKKVYNAHESKGFCMKYLHYFFLYITTTLDRRLLQVANNFPLLLGYSSISHGRNHMLMAFSSHVTSSLTNGLKNNLKISPNSFTSVQPFLLFLEFDLLKTISLPHCYP